MVLFLAVLAVVVVGTGMDRGKVHEWRQRWLNFHPDTKVQVEAPDLGLLVPDGKKTAAVPSMQK